MKKMLSIYGMVIAMSMIVSYAKAQNSISLVRYDDNFTPLKNDGHKKGLSQLKYISISKGNYISFGGELREQYQFYNNINFGHVPPSYRHLKTSQWNHRLMLHANMEWGDHVRIFVQLNNTLRFLNKNPAAPEIDENQLSLHQAFAEIKLKKWKFRLGRQELFYGNHRLFTVREGPNTRKAFDGMVIKKILKKGSIDLFAISPTVSRQYVFDDASFKESIVGIYGTQYSSGRKTGLDYYAVNFRSKLRKYNNRPGFENRQTYGLRLFSNLKRINVELEGNYQSGKFGNLSIDAYSFLADLNMMVLPRVKAVTGFVVNAASGDKNSGDRKLNTYNLMYAKPAYGLVAPIGSTNIISLSPYIKISPVQKLNVLAEVFFLSRNSIHDGVYAPSMTQSMPANDMPAGSAGSRLGELYIIETSYQQNKNLSFSLDVSYFKAGTGPHVTGYGKDITYLSFKSTFKF